MFIRELEKINCEIEKTANKEGRLYMFGNFIPNKKVMFVAEMPATSKIKYWHPRSNFTVTKSDEKFLALLNKYGFGGSYITDFVKTVTKVREPTKKEKLEFAPYLLNEIAILKPIIVIAVGLSAHRMLSEIEEKIEVPIEIIWHPAYAKRCNKWKEYEKQIKNLSLLIQKSHTDS